MEKNAEVVIIGSGFGGSVAALRFAEAGKKVVLLERGGWVSREKFEADGEMLWQPDKGRNGINDLRKRGDHILSWAGAGVGGGSHVYGAALKRRVFFDDFPIEIAPGELDPYYDLSEKMLLAVQYPDYPPYSELPAFRIFREGEKKLMAERPDIVETQGSVLIAMAFAPEGKNPGDVFTNEFGAMQRYANPREQTMLGGDIDVKNSLDRNYLHLARQKGAEILDFAEVTRIETTPEGGYRVSWQDPRKTENRSGTVSAAILVCSAGSIGSTELLLKSRDHYKTLPRLSAALGKNYFTNGNFVTFMVPKKGLLTSWLGVVVLIIGLILTDWLVIAAGAAAYLAGWLLARNPIKPDMGSLNSDYIRFKHRDGTAQGLYIQGGRYPTPVKALVSFLMSLAGKFHPEKYRTISRTINWMGKYIPFFELLERSWPIPLLVMGRDDAAGQFYLNKNLEAEIDFPFDQNKAYIKYLEEMGRLLSRKAGCYFVPNFFAKLFKKVEVPHSLGGVAMGKNKEEGVVDGCGRVFGYENFLVLDGSIMPVTLGTNPANTIAAFAERAMEKVRIQLDSEGRIKAEDVGTSRAASAIKG